MTDTLFHIALFLIAVSMIFFFCGVLIDSTDRIARRVHRSSFLIAFLLLGFLTSFGELSVAINSSVAATPQISAGNLIGASFVIFFLLIPILAIFGNGISLKHTLSTRNLAFALSVIVSPALFVFDGQLTKIEGAAMIMLYLALTFILHKDSGRTAAILEKEETLVKKELYLHGLKIILAASLIFISGKIFVQETVFFSDLLRIPPSFIGLVVIAIGTNVPELTIALRSIRRNKQKIAFGDYIGSASFNTAILGGLAMIDGPFSIDHTVSLLTALFLALGLAIFFFFARSKRMLSYSEGMVLGVIYLLFIAAQFSSLL